jgi:hypothetical protein
MAAYFFGSSAITQNNAEVLPEIRFDESAEPLSYNEQKRLGVEKGRERMEALFAQPHRAHD